MYDVGECLLADLLLQARMSQQELANKLGVSRQQINSYANNRKTMSLHTAINVAAVLRCNVTDLYELIPVEVRSKRR